MQHLQSNADWKPLYEAALLETDSSRLSQRIIVDRRAILDRIEESLREPVASEYHAMNEALRHLQGLAEIAAPSIEVIYHRACDSHCPAFCDRFVNPTQGAHHPRVVFGMNRPGGTGVQISSSHNDLRRLRDLRLVFG